MVSVAEAEKIIQSRVRDFGTEKLPFHLALGRVLAEDIRADRDLPPFNRVTMDGIAISFQDFENGQRSFQIIATQAAGELAVNINQPGECIEIMTGAAVPESTDTIIRYEDLSIKNGTATILVDSIKKGQNIHYKAKDKKQNEIVATAGQFVSPALINMAAAVGASMLLVKKLPRVVIISSGDELIEVNETPLVFQVRSSNNYAINAVLQQYALNAEMLHIPDEPQVTKQKIQECLQKYDVMILTGGVSMGKFDYIPQVLEELSVEKLFHKVKQKPGKPFWFGVHSNSALVFAFPGNPVSTFMCLHRYFLPWLEASLGLMSKQPLHAVLNDNFSFTSDLQYFLQVALHVSQQGQLYANPVEGNGSGDFANLLETDAFMELPMGKNNFIKGETYRIWPFKKTF